MQAQRPQRRVAQKLAYARWHLDWSDSLVDTAKEGAEVAVQQREALLQSALFHLVGAYRAFLGEIAADIHLLPDDKAPDCRSAERLSAAYTDYLPPALMQCVNLEREVPDSPGDMAQYWLANLLVWFAEMERVAGAQGPPAPPANVAGGALIAVSTHAGERPDRGNLGYCLARLEQLIERLRDDLQEC